MKGRPAQLKTGSDTRTMGKISSWQVSVAAEAAVAMLFARAGWNVSVQYGANQPEYDLMVERDGAVLKVSVKGSQDGSWGLSQSLLKNADYHAAAEEWLSRHTAGTIYAFVQFRDVELASAPRVYLARPDEVAIRLKETAKGRGDTILYEHKPWTKRAFGSGTVDAIPLTWEFSEARVRELAAASPGKSGRPLSTRFGNTHIATGPCPPAP